MFYIFLMLNIAVRFPAVMLSRDCGFLFLLQTSRQILRGMIIPFHIFSSLLFIDDRNI